MISYNNNKHRFQTFKCE